MGYNNFFRQDELDGKKSKFNAASLQMQRIHRLQDIVNFCSFNLLQFNPDLGDYNYIIKYRCLNQLYNESYPKASRDEKKRINTIKKLFKNAVKALPVMKREPDSGFTMKTVVDDKNWDRIQEYLDAYEKIVRELLDRSEMNTPDQDEPAGFDI